MEDIGSLAAHDLANELTAMTRAAHDLLDRNALTGELGNRGISLFTAQISFVLQFFRAAEQVWIDRCRAECGTDRSHGFAHRIEEGRAGILHEMPAIRDLCRMRQCLYRGLPVAPAPISR